MQMNDDAPLDQRAPLWANPRVVGGSVAALLFLFFVLQNTRSVQVSFLFWHLNMRLIVLMALCAAGGIGIWELGRYLKRRHDRG
jgi:uncharacterized integral membrane protein